MARVAQPLRSCRCDRRGARESGRGGGPPVKKQLRLLFRDIRRPHSVIRLGCPVADHVGRVCIPNTSACRYPKPGAGWVAGCPGGPGNCRFGNGDLNEP